MDSDMPTINDTKDEIDQALQLWEENYGDPFYTKDLTKEEKEAALKGARVFTDFLKLMQHVSKE